MMLEATTVSAVTFHDYVKKAADGDSDERIGARIGTTGKTVGSWKTVSPNARFVIEFARQYGRPVSEALMEAYGLTPAEMGVPVSADPAQLSNDALVAEVARRLHAFPDGSSPEDVSTSDRLKRQQAEQRRQRSQQRQRDFSPER